MAGKKKYKGCGMIFLVLIKFSEFNSAKQPGAPDGEISPRQPKFSHLPKLFCRE
jgi:hypothetical protein